ncbi:MAG: sugar ABC transporter permease, partial [Candidatus Hydrogenedentes bacterium]|nr:sugar ABC transporter permease [Candidatus Hydrogenedentota bacterium]
MKSQTRITLTALCFLLPNFIGFMTFTLVPVLFSLGASFTNWNIMQTVTFQWVGLANYVKLLTDPQFWVYAVNTFYLMLGMPVSIA